MVTREQTFRYLSLMNRVYKYMIILFSQSSTMQFSIFMSIIRLQAYGHPEEVQGVLQYLHLNVFFPSLCERFKQNPKKAHGIGKLCQGRPHYLVDLLLAEQLLAVPGLAS
jgi:hypothetical protein